ncbi:FAD-dependent oxidoreductase [Streptomyces sp. NPDC005070]
MNTATTLAADVLIVGFGKGGKTAAHQLADAGRRVILIEQPENMYGDTCPNVGCVPTKMLVHYSNEKRTGRREEVLRQLHRRRPRSDFRAGNFESLDGKDTAAVITGTARFIDPHTVTMGEDEDLISVTAPTILINTGSESVVPSVLGLANSPHQGAAPTSSARATFPSTSWSSGAATSGSGGC